MKSRFALVIFLGTMVAACSGDPLEVHISNCPAVAVLGDLGTVTRFVGTGRDIKDVAYTATISSVFQDCDENQQNIGSTITFDIVANKGSALQENTVPLQYFIAVFRDNTTMVTKKIYDVTLHFDAATGRAVSRQTVKSLIPNIEQARRYDYEVTIGFQMSNDEVAYNVAR